MANLKFVLGTDELEFTRGVRYPISAPSRARQAMIMTAAGVPIRQRLGANTRRRKIVFQDLPSSLYAALLEWFEDIAQGATNEFTYFDEEGYSMGVIITTPEINFPLTGYQRHAGELELMVVS